MQLDVLGCRINVREAGDPGGAPTVLVHGGGGHHHWWDGVLPHLTGRRVLAMDLSGHGDSGRRDDYVHDAWAEEIAAVARAAGPGAEVIGHSMGGRMGALAAARHPDAIARLVIVDSALPLLPRDGTGADLPVVRPRREYATREDAVAHFHLLPREPEDPAAIAALGEHSVVRDGDVWTFKFDPRIFGHLTDTTAEDALPDVRCDLLSITGALSAITSPAMTAELQERLGRDVPHVTIEGAHHHVPLTHPAELAGAL